MLKDVTININNKKVRYVFNEYKTRMEQTDQYKKRLISHVSCAVRLQEIIYFRIRPMRTRSGRQQSFFPGQMQYSSAEGPGVSTAAGLSYGGQRFQENFGEFIENNGASYMTDMYSAGFYPFPTEEEKWGYWSKHAYLNRIEPEALPLYQQIFELVKEKSHFILTTNVDHQFWKAGFMDERIVRR